MVAITRREYSGNAAATTLTSDISNSATSIPVTDGTGFPTGTNPFFIVIGRGTSSEEKILCSSRTGNTITVSSRGADDTSAVSHDAGAAVEHVWTAQDADDTNKVAAALTTKGDLLGFSTEPTRVPVGADGTVPVADSTDAEGLTYGDHGDIGGLSDDDHPQYGLHVQTVVFTADGTFAKADYSGLRYVRVRAIGGGGKGGSALNTSTGEVSVGGGAGGGGYAEAVVAAASLATSETVTVGVGGTTAPSGNGEDGTASSFGTHAVASGGGGGDTSALITGAFGGALPGAGAVGTSGGILAGGSAGSPGHGSATSNRAHGGTGGGTPLGGGGKGGNALTATGSSGEAGRSYGAGGGGAANRASETAKAGGNGANGVVIVEVFRQATS